MWSLWTKAKSYSQLPSKILEEEDSIAAWMLDTAVTWFGITFENALAERVKIQYGKEVQYKPKYSLSLLLNPNFRLPRPERKPEDDPNPWATIIAWAGKKNSGVKRYRYVS